MKMTNARIAFLIDNQPEDSLYLKKKSLGEARA
jgi:hypothetical protein